MSDPGAFQTIVLRNLDDASLTQLSKNMKLALSLEDMQAIQQFYDEENREPTCVELECIAQTWSEHCKHRIFNAIIEHKTEAGKEEIKSLFKTYIRHATETIMAQKPGFVLSCFHDNAGFVELDEEYAVCLKAETHNHPSAIEPYAGANTGIGGVIRDILGAGKGAKPIASLDVFCFGRLDRTYTDELKHVIHPVGIFRGVVRGVRDYGNRMGIPTVTGAIFFHERYLYNPLVFCGTAGIIPRRDIDKKVLPGQWLATVGGRTGKDGLHGATFSSASLTTDSHEEDQGAVQIGNPIEEKKVADFILAAREKGLIQSISDCGAGGYSSAAGEMLSETGGEVYLHHIPLKAEDMTAWELFLSESQERMVLAYLPEDEASLSDLATVYDTTFTPLAKADESKRLKVFYKEECVCDLPIELLNEAPVKRFESTWVKPKPLENNHLDEVEPDCGTLLKKMLVHLNICSREPVIREYDHEVQGNTMGKPLAGATGDAPQDGSVLAINGSEKLVSMGVSILPQYGDLDPYRMGVLSVDECLRQLVVTGADPDRIAILDNFCMGNPEQPEELGKLVEAARGICDAAISYGAPFVSGKDSFYNYFETDHGPQSIPMTILISGMGVLDDKAHRLGATIRKSDSILYLLGETGHEFGGSVYFEILGRTHGDVPTVDTSKALGLYRSFYQVNKAGYIRSAHDLSEGGLAVAAAEAGFGLVAGIALELSTFEELFSESGGRILVEVAPEHQSAFEAMMEGCPFKRIGQCTDAHRQLTIHLDGNLLVNEHLDELKALWKSALTPYY